MATSVTAKGQVTIPKHVRDALGLKSGAKVEFILEEGYAILEPSGASASDSLRGSLKAFAGKRGGRSDKELLDNVKRSVAHAAAGEGLSSRHKRHREVSSRG